VSEIEPYTVEKVHMSALQKRLYPQAANKPFVVRETASGELVGLPDRYRSRSGAQARADRMNALEKGYRHGTVEGE
jgi:hypothetical protein